METQSIWHPWQEMRRLQREMEHLVGDLSPAWRWPLTGDYPPLNVTRTDTGLAVDALCPGVERDTIDVTVVGDALTIRCERKAPEDVPLERYHRRERPVGVFTRTIAVGERFDPDRTEARYTNGILHVELARAPEAAPKKIPIQS
jgi:HSP20 family protein